MLALETAKTLEKGQTGIRAGGGGGFNGEVSFAGGMIRVRHGVAKNLDFRVDLTALSLNTADALFGTNVVATAGAGIKYAFNPYFALAVDLTGGYWVGGGFLTPELNLIAAYENKWFVPFVDAGYYTSHPLSPNDVETAEDLLGPPVFTHGWITGVGFRVPTTRFDRHRVASALVAGTRFTGAYFNDQFESGADNAQVYWSGSVALEVVFP